MNSGKKNTSMFSVFAARKTDQGHVASLSGRGKAREQKVWGGKNRSRWEKEALKRSRIQKFIVGRGGERAFITSEVMRGKRLTRRRGGGERKLLPRGVEPTLYPRRREKRREREKQNK